MVEKMKKKKGGKLKRGEKLLKYMKKKRREKFVSHEEKIFFQKSMPINGNILPSTMQVPTNSVCVYAYMHVYGHIPLCMYSHILVCVCACDHTCVCEFATIYEGCNECGCLVAYLSIYRKKNNRVTITEMNK